MVSLDMDGLLGIGTRLKGSKTRAIRPPPDECKIGTVRWLIHINGDATIYDNLKLQVSAPASR
jgi:hypothetical protein